MRRFDWLTNEMFDRGLKAVLSGEGCEHATGTRGGVCEICGAEI
jgi:hypothetical protein